MRDDLQYDLCPGCAEPVPVNAGILYHTTHTCPLNTYTYRNTGRFTIRQFANLMFYMDGGQHEMQQFKDLLDFPYFKAMPNFETASDLDKRIYGLIRDMEVKQMKRLRAYIELEEEFNSKY